MSFLLFYLSHSKLNPSISPSQYKHVSFFVVGWCLDWFCLGRCPSLYLFPLQLILGFVSSIWAKFSNGHNNRGRPGEWRRWVPPLTAWAACFSKPVNHVFQHSPLTPPPSWVTCHVAYHRGIITAPHSSHPVVSHYSRWLLPQPLTSSSHPSTVYSWGWALFTISI